MARIARVIDWGEFLKLSSTDELEIFRLHARTERLLGNSGFVEKMGTVTGKGFAASKTRTKEETRGLSVLSLELSSKVLHKVSTFDNEKS
jgi:hypothetical protein